MSSVTNCFGLCPTSCQPSIPSCSCANAVKLVAAIATGTFFYQFYVTGSAALAFSNLVGLVKAGVASGVALATSSPVAAAALIFAIFAASVFAYTNCFGSETPNQNLPNLH